MRDIIENMSFISDMCPTMETKLPLADSRQEEEEEVGKGEKGTRSWRI